MKTKMLLYLSIVGLSTLTTPAAAQVKIGSNPTTIEPNSNLEVEASTAGRKMKVDKTTGQVSITDGTQGAGKVLTSDSIGGTSWQYPLSGAMVNGTTGNQITVTSSSAVQTYSGGSITFARAGTYMVTARWWITGSPTTTSPIPNHAFINTALSTSSSTYNQAGIAAEWVVVSTGVQHTTPSFRVTVAGPQTLYFWFHTGFFTGNLQFLETYAIGPF